MSGKYKDRSVRRKYEFLANAEKFPWFIESHQKSADVAVEVLNAMSAAKSDELLRLQAAKIARVLGHNSTTLRSGALDATLQSGDRRYITNPTIRERLSAWPHLVVDATENEDLLRNLKDPKLVEALARDVDLTKIDAVTDACWDDPALEECAAITIILPKNTEFMPICESPLVMQAKALGNSAYWWRWRRTSSSSSIRNWRHAETAAVVAKRYRQSKERKNSFGMVGPLSD